MAKLDIAEYKLMTPVEKHLANPLNTRKTEAKTLPTPAQVAAARGTPTLTVQAAKKPAPKPVKIPLKPKRVPLEGEEKIASRPMQFCMSQPKLHDGLITVETEYKKPNSSSWNKKTVTIKAQKILPTISQIKGLNPLAKSREIGKISHVLEKAVEVFDKNNLSEKSLERVVFFGILYYIFKDHKINLSEDSKKILESI